jgi:hypothetical protein
LDGDNRASLERAEQLANELKSLVVEYQTVVKANTEGPSPQGETDRIKRSLDRRFRLLQPQQLISHLRQIGELHVADRLDDLWRLAAMVFNLVAVSIGVDESEVLDIDINLPYCSLQQSIAEALRRRSPAHRQSVQ